MSKGGKDDAKYINGLKGLTCVFVMLGHYVGFYKYAEAFPTKISILDLINNSTMLRELTSESFWVVLFLL